MSIQNRELQLLKKEEYPKFNGNKISSIYAVYENSRHVKGGYLADILFYNCYYEYYDLEKRRFIKSVMKVKNLPEPFNEFMGQFITKRNGKTDYQFWCHIFYIRTSTSGHASPDQTLDLEGWGFNGTHDSVSMYRGLDWSENYILSWKKGLGKRILDKIIGKEFEVEEIEFANCGYKMEEGTLDFATKYPYKYTPIRFIDGMVYPDEKLPSWRWLHGMPFRRPTDADKSDNTNIRVWDESLKQHVFLTRAENVEVGDSNMVEVIFKNKHNDIYGNDSFVYCHIRRFIAEHNHEFIKYEVVKQSKDGTFYGRISNPKNSYNKKLEIINPRYMYYITNIHDSLTHKNQTND